MTTISKYTLWLERHSGWILIWLFSVVPVILWLRINPIQESFAGWYGVFSSLGKIFGLVGFVLYALNLLLAVRRSWLENFFQGLNRVYIAHHITGGIALALLVFHPFFLALRYVDLKLVETFADAAKFLWPREVNLDAVAFAEVQDAVSINAGIVAFWGMVVLLVLTFFVKLPYRVWLFTHKFLGVAFVFSMVHVATISSDTDQSLMLKAYMAVWGLVGIGAYLYRTIFGGMIIKRTAFKVSRVSSDGAVTMIELLPMNRRLDYKPGQFVFIRFIGGNEDGVTSEAHPFSVASAPDEKELRLYVKALGDFTSSLKGLRVGTVAEIEGVFGRFTAARYGTDPQIWIAGGIGVTPFLSMARTLQQMPQRIDMIYTVRTRSEMVESSVLSDMLPKSYANFNFIPYITDEKDGAFLSVEFIKDQVGDVQGREIFLCGPPLMMKSLREQLRSIGVPNHKIHSEEFTMS